MSQRALVTGATGLLGRQVLKAFENADYEVVGAGYSRAAPPKIRKLDICNVDEVSELVNEVKPQVIVHCAADRQPDSCTQNPEGARNLNVKATANLASLCVTQGIFLIYISTDYVFAGQPGEAPYKATATPKPTNIYGETKREGETEVLKQLELNQNGNAVILRVPVLYGETDPKENNKESAVNVIMDALWKANQPSTEAQSVKMDDWAIRYPTNTEDVARVCVDITKLYTSGDSDPSKTRPRILQFSSEDRMTKYEIMSKFAEIMGLNLDKVVADKDGGKPGADGTLRPYDCHLSTQELVEMGIDVHTVDFVAWWRRYVGAFRH